MRTGPGGRVSGRVPGLDERKLATAITQTTRMLSPAKDLAADDERARSARSLTSHTDASGLTRYKLVLDAEGAAIVERLTGTAPAGSAVQAAVADALKR